MPQSYNIHFLLEHKFYLLIKSIIKEFSPQKIKFRCTFKKYRRQMECGTFVTLGRLELVGMVFLVGLNDFFNKPNNQMLLFYHSLRQEFIEQCLWDYGRCIFYLLIDWFSARSSHCGVTYMSVEKYFLKVSLY